MSSLSFENMAVTLTEANTYFSNRGNSVWAAETDDNKNYALRRGQDFIAGQYNTRWITEFENNDAPTQVKYAIFEAAYRELTSGALTADLERGGRIQSLQAGSVGVTYMNGAPAETRYPVIENLLRDLVYGSSTRRLVRA